MSRWFGRVGSEDALPDNMPALYLIADSSCGEESVRCVASGCEEEGIPLAWDAKPGSAAELAREACLRSKLEVGIGLDQDGNGAIAMVTVTDKPYVERRAETARQLRWIGQTAARMSKSEPVVQEDEENTPVRSSGDSHEEFAVSEEETPQEADLESMVSMVLHEILRLNREGGVAGDA